MSATTQADGAAVELKDTASSHLRNALGIIESGRVARSERFSLMSNEISALGARIEKALALAEADEKAHVAMHVERNELLRALFTFGEHKKGCDSLVGDPCSCGLGQLLVEDEPVIIDDGEGAES